VVAAKRPNGNSAGPDDVYQSGTLALDTPLFRAPTATIRLLVQGLGTYPIGTEVYTENEPYSTAKVNCLSRTLEDTS